jgi:hypothetical protein
MVRSCDGNLDRGLAGVESWPRLEAGGGVTLRCGGELVVQEESGGEVA